MTFHSSKMPGFALLALLGACGSGDGGSGSSGGSGGRCGAGEAGMPGWFRFETRTRVERWIGAEDTAAMRTHATMLWRGLTEMNEDSRASQPVFERWPTKEETFAIADAPRPIRRLEPPTQFAMAGHARDARLLSSSEGAVVTQVFYNCAMYRHIRDNRYHLAPTLRNLNEGWGTRPIANREITDFPNNSVMVKVAYQIVARDRPTVLGYWSGPSESTTPATPGPTTWTSRMVVQPPGGAASGGRPAGLPIVPISRFYHRQLTAAEAQALAGELGTGQVRAGDYLILVAMHVATREVPNWTWQSFWWSFHPPRNARDTQVQAPFTNYAFDVGYSFNAPAGNLSGLPRRLYNPYLEAEFGEEAFSKPGQRGIESNCMSCHRAAAWPVETARFIANGHIDDGDAFFFRNNTKTDYVWGIPEQVQAATPRHSGSSGQ